ncbi:hypothetical protein B0H16DRAFT_582208 [Mycena metata]|uniref:Uncharacterized protein n=1 Tax=Mycena metata TaxID=1033252 RepID=A0AAD7H4I2_9AGAR|nr:hypothetical protein B0H16DRAFT_582208 [Mycena metata]
MFSPISVSCAPRGPRRGGFCLRRRLHPLLLRLLRQVLRVHLFFLPCGSSPFTLPVLLCPGRQKLISSRLPPTLHASIPHLEHPFSHGTRPEHQLPSPTSVTSANAPGSPTGASTFPFFPLSPNSTSTLSHNARAAHTSLTSPNASSPSKVNRTKPPPSPLPR